MNSPSDGGSHRLAFTLLGLSEESLDAVLGAACRMRQLKAVPSLN
jgi:hypothetical protein